MQENLVKREFSCKCETYKEKLLTTTSKQKLSVGYLLLLISSVSPSAEEAAIAASEDIYFLVATSWELSQSLPLKLRTLRVKETRF